MSTEGSLERVCIYGSWLESTGALLNSVPKELSWPLKECYLVETRVSEDFETMKQK